MTADELDKKIHDFIVYDLEAYPTRLLKTLRNCIKEFYSFRLKSVPEKCQHIPQREYKIISKLFENFKLAVTAFLI